MIQLKLVGTPIIFYCTKLVRFQALTAASMKFRIFWDILPCSQIDLTTQQYIPEDSELCTKLHMPVSTTVHELYAYNKIK
jgi:hypothetical protein